MGRDLGIDQSAISKILAGKQEPSATLLERLAAWPGVDIGWLFLGRGEPLLEEGMRAGVGQFRPLADELLPGPPDEHPDRLRGLSYPVAAAFYSHSSYWYRVPPRSAVVGSCGDVLVRDQMLIETDERWTRQGGAVLGKFCVFRIRTGPRGRMLLGKVDVLAQEYFESYERFKVDFFGDADEASLVIAESDSGMKEGLRVAGGMGLVMQQICGVCVLLERPFERQVP
jgi:transcriptional regulator with XRE-family HTH domain